MPTIEIPDKICPHCGNTKWYYEAKRNVYSCYSLRKERQDLWRNKTLEKYREYKRNYYHTKMDKKKHYDRCRELCLKNPEKTNAYKLKYFYTEKGKAKYKEHKESSIIYLKNSYIKDLICKRSVNLESKDIPQELIELKRKELLLTRTIRNNGN